MSEYQSSDIRVSDTEREDALGKLGEHMSAGRLDIDEYGERTAKVATAKTRGEVLGLFGDLPEPRPAFGQPVPAVARTRRAAAEDACRAGRAGGAVRWRPSSWSARWSCCSRSGFFVPLLFFFLFMNHGWRGGPGHRERRDAMRERQRYMRDHYRHMGRGWRDERG